MKKSTRFIEIDNPSSRRRVLILFSVIILLLIFFFFYSLNGFSQDVVIQSPTVFLKNKEITQQVMITLTPTITPTVTITLYPTDTSTPTATIIPTVVEGEPFVIGTSVNGLPLQVVRFGNGPSHRMIIAGIHGGYEWNTVALADKLIEYLRKNPEKIPSNVTLYILDDLNPDGLAHGHGAVGRGNANTVDLNRNWDANWKQDWNRQGCFNQVWLSGGKNPESEPEVKALADFIRSHSLDALISYHSAALGIFAGGQPSTENSQSLAKAVSQVSPYHYPSINSGCEYTGQLIDWAAAQGIAALDIELSTHADLDLQVNERILSVFLSWKGIDETSQ